VMGLSKFSVSDNFGAEVFINRAIENVPVLNYAIPKYSPSGIDSIYFIDANTSVTPLKSGNIVVYTSYPYGLPIIHRAVVLIHASDGDFVLTKGDNQLTNPTFDADCGSIVSNSSQKSCITFYAVKVSSISGKAFFNVPKVGCVKLWLFDDFSSLIVNGKLPRDFSGLC